MSWLDREDEHRCPYGCIASHNSYLSLPPVPSPFSRPVTPTPYPDMRVTNSVSSIEYPSPTAAPPSSPATPRSCHSDCFSDFSLPPPLVLERSSTDPFAEPMREIREMQLHQLQRLMFNTVIDELNALYSIIIHHNICLALVPYQTALVPVDMQRRIFADWRLESIPSFVRNLSVNYQFTKGRSPGNILRSRLTLAFFDYMHDLETHYYLPQDLYHHIIKSHLDNIYDTMMNSSFPVESHDLVRRI